MGIFGKKWIKKEKKNVAKELAGGIVLINAQAVAVNYKILKETQKTFEKDSEVTKVAEETFDSYMKDLIWSLEQYRNA